MFLKEIEKLTKDLEYKAQKIWEKGPWEQEGS